MCLAKISITIEEGENGFLGPSDRICCPYLLVKLQIEEMIDLEVMPIFKVSDAY